MTDRTGDPTERQRLLDSLWEDARREGEKLLAETRATADRLIRETACESEEKVTEALEKAREQLSPELAGILNRARIRSEEEILKERTRILDTCFDEALRRLVEDDRTGERLRASVARLLDISLKAIGNMRDVSVQVSEPDLEQARRLTRSRDLAGRVEIGPDIAGGVRITAAGGDRILDNTVRSRLARIREDPPLKLYRTLFAGPGPEEQVPVK